MPTSSAGKVHPLLQPGQVHFSNVKNRKTQVADIAVNIKTTLSFLDSKITSLKSHPNEEILLPQQGR